MKKGTALFHKFLILLSCSVTLCCVQNSAAANADPSDSVYINDAYYQKLLKVAGPIPVFYNEQVRRQLGNYTRNYSGASTALLGKAQYYYNLYAPVFEKAGVPKQLFLLCAVNTGCNPTYADDDGASGMWPISYAIAKKYGLVTNSYIDERRNAEKSAIAAAAYLKDLHNIYQDWLKVIAAFRAGPINVNIAIRKAGNSLSYDHIHPQLSAQHQEAVVNYMAFWYLWNYHADHKLIVVKYKLPDTDTVHVRQEISISSIAYNINYDEETLKRMNAELRSFIVPVSYNEQGFRLPRDKVQEYHDKILVLFPPPPAGDTSKRDTLILEEDPARPRPVHGENISSAPDEESEEKPKAPPAKGKQTIIYIVKSGDGLLLLADLFDCRVSDIKSWNGMRKDAIYKGQKLKIMVPKAKVAEYKKINKMTLAQKKKLAKRS